MEIAFWTISRRVTQVSVRNYMMISAYGMMLIFTSNQLTNLVLTPFPPFGIVTMAFLSLASFLMLLGIYSAAISVAQDLEIRKHIRRSIKQLALLDGIGSSQVNQETEKIVKRVMKEVAKEKEDMEEITGVPSSLEEKELRNYLDLVLKETTRAKNP